MVLFTLTIAVCQQAGVLGELRGNLLVGAQYLMDCHIAPEQYVAQVGGGRMACLNLKAELCTG